MSALAERRNARLQGFSLVELLVAMTLGLVLMGGTIAVFSGNKRSNELNTAMAEMQESARFALERMARDVRNAGYQGCLSIESGALAVGSKDTPIIADEPPTQDLALSATTGHVVQKDHTWKPAAPTGFDAVKAKAVPGTHALVLQFGGPQIGVLAAPQATDSVPDPTAPLLVKGAFPAGEDDLAVVSDCERAVLFRVSDAVYDPPNTTIEHAPTHNDSGSLGTLPFGGPTKIAETQVLRFNASVYYIAETGRKNARGEAIRALYQQTLPFDAPKTNPPTELIEGVENMRLTFAVESGGGVRYSAPGDAGYAPDDVQAVRIGLLMSSWDHIAQQEDSNTYLLAGQPISASDGTAGLDSHPVDRRHRLAFNTTVKVRNRRRQ